MVNLTELKKAIEVSWSAETSFVPDEWSEDNPARGQCAVTALIVQDYFGGKIRKCDVVGGADSHFFNELPNGEIVDLTRIQFPEDTQFEHEKVTDREKTHSYPGTAGRYEILRARVEAIFA